MPQAMPEAVLAVDPVAASPDAPHGSVPRLRYELAAAMVLVRRDLTRFFRQRSRILGALLQPLIFWAVLGSGLSGSFRIAGAEQTSYLEFFFPGVILLVVLFTSIFSTMSVIEDRREGFLQAILVAPSSRTSLVLGKTLGGVAIALLQATLVALAAPLAGFALGAIDWPLVALALVLVSIGLTAVGFTFAWWLDSVQGYHGIMSVLLIPAWILSGAMFPPAASAPWLATVMRYNPLSYAMDVLRRGLYGPRTVPGALGASLGLGLAVLGGFAMVALALAIRQAGRRR